ncbi:MAG: hypothetical protein ACE5IE_06140 [Dehalococcoidia bacterium]
MRRLSSFQLIFLLLVIALLAGNAYFGYRFYQAVRMQAALAQDIAAVEVQIAALGQIYNIDALQAELAALEQQLDDSPFPKEVESTDIFNLVRTSGNRANVDWSFAEVGETEEEIDGSPYKYRVFSYEIEATGTLTNIFNFITRIEADAPYNTLKMDDVELTYDSTTGDWTIAFDILVFAQPL